MKALSLIFFLTFFYLQTTAGDSSVHYMAETAAEAHDNERIHELTIFVVPSLYELDWSSPSSLLETTFKSYSIALFRKNAYSIGHLFIELSTPLLDTVLLTSIRSSSGAEKRKLVLSERIGLGILGAYLSGRMETCSELTKKVVHFAREKKLACIKFRLSEVSAVRVIEYFRRFTSETEDGYSPCDYYGGAFWPGFENEGAGCTSFGMTAMKVAGLSINHPEWKVTVDIPMELVGGEYNRQRKITRRSIRRTHNWYIGEGRENIDFIHLSIFDPSLIFNWILDMRKKITAGNSDNQGFVNVDIKNFRGVKRVIPGLYFDARNIIVSDDEPLFFNRDRSSVFIDIFLKHVKSINPNKKL